MLREINIVLGDAGSVEDDIIQLILGTDDVIFMPERSDLWDVLAATKLFTSKGQARKNFKPRKCPVTGWLSDVDLDSGLSAIHQVGRFRVDIFVYKPIKDD